MAAASGTEPRPFSFVLCGERKDNMKTDRELLEFAAKAIDGWLYDGIDGLCICTREGGAKLWNPLTDDGDALRLAVKVGISLTMRAAGCEATDLELVNAYEPDGKDPYAATRRAIVRAAAEIGAKATVAPA